MENSSAGTVPWERQEPCRLVALNQITQQRLSEQRPLMTPTVDTGRRAGANSPTMAVVGTGESLASRWAPTKRPWGSLQNRKFGVLGHLIFFRSPSFLWKSAYQV